MPQVVVDLGILRLKRGCVRQYIHIMAQLHDHVVSGLYAYGSFCGCTYLRRFIGIVLQSCISDKEGFTLIQSSMAFQAQTISLKSRSTCFGVSFILDCLATIYISTVVSRMGFRQGFLPLLLNTTRTFRC